MKNEFSLIQATTGQLPAYTLTQQAIALKESALESAALIGKVTNAEENTMAVEAQKGLKEIIALAEKQRKAAKEPLLQLGRQLDAAVAAWVREVDEEYGRISNLVTDFAAAEMRRVREEEEIQRRRLAEIEAQRQAELRRIAEEQARKEREAREAKEAAERAAREAKNQKEREAAAKAAADAELKRKEAEIAAAASVVQSQAVEEKAASAAYAESRPVEATRTAGQVVTYDWKITVTNPYELARCCPDCVKIEPLLTPIKTKLNAGVTVPGIKAEKFIKANVRAGGQKVIEV
jgi:hypothetical protein